MSFGKIKITEFALRHFDTKFGGTKITDIFPEDFERNLNELLSESSLDVIQLMVDLFGHDSNLKLTDIRIMDGYAPFCKLISIPNFTSAKVGSLPITIANHQYIRHGYSARTEKELPVMSRWFELPLPAIIADYLIVVVYSKEQIDKEDREMEGKGNNLDEKYIPFDADWGVVSILGQTHPNEEPIQPVTMMRNALGTQEGGSGVPINKEKYLASVSFWQNNVNVKS